jgi:hypothetical protein
MDRIRLLNDARDTLFLFLVVMDSNTGSAVDNSRRDSNILKGANDSQSNDPPILSFCKLPRENFGEIQDI